MNAATTSKSAMTAAANTRALIHNHVSHVFHILRELADEGPDAHLIQLLRQPYYALDEASPRLRELGDGKYREQIRGEITAPDLAKRDAIVTRTYKLLRLQPCPFRFHDLDAYLTFRQACELYFDTLKALRIREPLYDTYGSLKARAIRLRESYFFPKTLDAETVLDLYERRR